MLIPGRFLSHAVDSSQVSFRSLQSPLAVQLPFEILDDVFQILYGDGPADGTFESSHFKEDGGDGALTLLSAICVCRQWYQVALPMIYRHVHIHSPWTLEKFIRTIKPSSFGESINVASVVYTLPPSTEVEKRCAKAYVAGCRALVSMRNHVPALANTVFSFNVFHNIVHTLVVRGSTGFLGDFSSISSLDLKATICGITPLLRLDISLPNLHTLTLRHYIILSESVWPEMPNLQCVRIINTVIYPHAENCAWLQTPKRLARLELVEVYDESNFTARLLECGCRETLEDLVVYKFNGPDASSLNMKSLKRLKRLCVGPVVFRNTEDPSTYLPTTIERLTLWDSDDHIHLLWMNGSIHNKLGLSRFLERGDYRFFTRLHTIRVKGRKERWEEFQEDWDAVCRETGERNIRLEMKLVEGECIPEYSG
jgi:hypothetical protein